MRSVRRRLSDRLLRAGATLELDRQEMWRNARRGGAREPGNGELQVFGMLDLLSCVSIRLGMMLMPAQVPASVERYPAPDASHRD
jgi:hypothetical protein